MVHHGAAANTVGEHVLSLGVFITIAAVVIMEQRYLFVGKITKTPCPIEP